MIVPMHNAEEYIAECLSSVLRQVQVDLKTVELSMYDDASSDATLTIVQNRMPDLVKAFGHVELASSAQGPIGCGASRNRAAERTSASILVFLDADDVMAPDRIYRSLAALGMPDDPDSLGERKIGRVGVVGGNFARIPESSTPRYTAYHKSLNGNTGDHGSLFAFAFRDVPLAMPTVACKRSVWEEVGKFVEGPRLPEDLWFQYGAMEKDWDLLKLPGDPLVMYRYHERMTSLQISRNELLRIRVAAFEKLVLGKMQWKQFSLWGAGRDGKEVFKSLSKEAQARVARWGEINPRKIGLRIYGVPVVHFNDLEPPIATCVALDRTDGEFEAFLASKQLRPGQDFVYLV